jgi:hypothetical protein
MRVRACLVFVLLILLAAAFAADRRVSAPTVADAAAAKAVLQKAVAAGRCYASELKYGATGTLIRGASEDPLPAGSYRAHIPLALAPLGDLNTSAITVTLAVNGKKRNLGILHFAKPDEFTDYAVDFTGDGGTASINIDWAITGETAKLARDQALGQNADKGPDEKDDIEEIDAAPNEDAEGMLAIKDLAKLPLRLATTGITIEPLGPVTVAKVDTDKIVYKPGEKGTGTVVLRNTGAAAVQAALKVEIRHGLDATREVAATTLTVPAEGTATWTGPFDTTGLHWGADLHATVRVGTGPTNDGRAIFGVTDNFWETAIVTGMMFSRDYVQPEAAETFMQRAKDNGFTALESGFWAPDEFGNFCPDEKRDIFFGGQGAYPGSVKGSRNVNIAAHKRGIATTVYSNLWGGDGDDSFVMMREHPEWFSDGISVSTDWLENWQLMFMNRVPAIHVWPVTNINRENSMEALKVHAHQLAKTRTYIGWDGVRYDSYYSDTWVKMATDAVRKMTEAEEPGFRWGYNSIIPYDVKADNLDVMCRGGQLVMEEGLRGVAKGKGKFKDYQETLASYRDIVWSHGGHLGLCYDRPMEMKGYGATLADVLYLCSSLLATGCHPYYSQMETEFGQYPGFALRYSEILYKNTMKPLKTPEATITFGAPAELMDWKRLARAADLGNGRYRVIVHLLQTPAEPLTLNNLAQKVPAPLRDFPVTVKLPAGAEVKGAWALEPAPTAHHTAVPVKRAGDAVTATIPQVRLWSVLVIDYTAKEGLQ